MASSSKNSEPNHIGAKASEKQKHQLRCINRLCNHGDSLKSADKVLCTIYDVDYKTGKMVCMKCFIKFFKHYKDQEIKRKEEKCILDSSLPSFDSYSVIDDPSGKEEEDEAEGEEPKPSTSRADLPVDQHVKNVVDSIVVDIINKNKHIIDQHKKSHKAFMKKEIKLLRARFDKVDEIVSSAEDQMAFLNKIFGINRPIITSLEPVDMNELEEENIEEEQEEAAMPEEKIKRLIEEVKMPKQAKRFQLDKSDKEDIILDRTVSVVVPTNLPLVGPLKYPVVECGQIVLAMKFNLIDRWYEGKVKNIAHEHYVHILFQTGEKLLKRKHIAYYTLNSVRFPVGCRVIAKFTDPNSQHVDDAFYAGIVAEPPQTVNTFRYLIFFDNGYVQYRLHKDIRLIAHGTSLNVVWKDVAENSQKLIKSYLEKYPERQMVKLTKQQSVRAAYQCKWHWAEVLEVDASLVKLNFTDFKHSEWIYRGSSRLYNIFEKQSKSDRYIQLRQSGLAF